jgi:prolyl-tRNA editing enzyme YbaK/EbsC (Cys-tRNA(Pro) deacylase)
MYNRNSVLLNLTPNWRDTSLSAHIDVENNTLQVELTPGTVFQIFCKSYDNTVKTEIAKKFDILNIYHYPITLALLPNTFLQEPLAKELFTHIDKALCSDKEFFLGHYVLLIAKKPEGADIDGYKNVLMVLEEHKIQYDILEHDMVLSINDVVREIGRQEGIMIKTLVFYCEDTKRYAIVALPHDKKINKARFAKQLGVHHKKLKFASEKKIVELGFPLGGIPPFGFPSDQNIEYFIDPSLKVVSSTNVFMGVGDNKKTLKLKSHDFCKLIQNYRELVLPSKAPGDK